jgi:DNA-binding response OmpR family regulator
LLQPAGTLSGAQRGLQSLRARQVDPHRQDGSSVVEHVYRLRRKLAAAGATSPRITTVRGIGYRLDP